MRKAVRVCVPEIGHYWFWLVTYKSRYDLIRAAADYQGVAYGQVGMSDLEEDGILGCFSDNKLKTNYLGIMRLFDLSSQTIVHESVHAAVCLANKRHGWSRSLSREKEETVAYSTDAIANAVMAVLYPEDFDA